MGGSFLFLINLYYLVSEASLLFVHRRGRLGLSGVGWGGSVLTAVQYRRSVVWITNWEVQVTTDYFILPHIVSPIGPDSLGLSHLGRRTEEEPRAQGMLMVVSLKLTNTVCKGIA